MRTRVLLFAVLFAAAVSCGREEPTLLPEEYSTIHYRVTVSSGEDTRATVNGDMHYVFEDGDRLYMSGTGDAAGKIYGYLDLISGANSTTAIFEGDLAGVEGYTATSSTPLSAVLVSSSDALHTASGGVVSAPNYDNAVASSFEEAIKEYSHFTSTLHFGDHSLILSQHSSFLCCSIKYSKASTPDNTELTIKILDSNNEVLRTASVQVSSSSLYLSTAEFVAAFPENTDLTGAYLTSQQGSSDPKNLPAIKSGESISLAANTYYYIHRTTLPGWDGFRIKAIQDDTNVTFNYANQDDHIEYSLDLGATWNSYTSVSAIPINANDEICFRGQRTNYKNAKNDQYGTPGDNPIFTATQKCYIAGNIMSLLADEDNLEPDAFNGAFSMGSGTPVTYIDIDPNDMLILPVTTMAERCYKGMFRKCTSLTRGPDLPATATGMATGCYNSMFRDCTSLKSVRCYFSCFTGGEYIKDNYNRDLIISWLDKWMDGITITGNLYCHPDMVEYWNNSKNQNGPWWTTDYQIATMSKNWTASEWETYPN